MGWNVSNSLHNQRIFAIITLVVITILNIFGVRLVALINNTGVLFEILGMVVFAFILALFHHHQWRRRDLPHRRARASPSGTFLVAMFMSPVRDLRLRHRVDARRGNENPRREAPKAILGSVIGAFVIGGIFLFAMLLAIPNMGAAIKGGFGPAQIIDANFSQRVRDRLPAGRLGGDLRLLPRRSRPRRSGSASAWRATTRLPVSGCSRAVHPQLHTPIGSCLAIGVLAVIPMLQYAGAAIIAIAATGMIYLSYLLGNLAVMRARLRGWPKRRRRSRSAGGASRSTLLALAVGRRDARQLRLAPSRDEPDAEPDGQLLNFHWNWLNDRPVLWTVAIVIALVGAVYFILVQRTKAAHLQAPEGEVFAEEMAAPAPGRRPSSVRPQASLGPPTRV